MRYRENNIFAQKNSYRVSHRKEGAMLMLPQVDRVLLIKDESRKHLKRTPCARIQYAATELTRTVAGFQVLKYNIKSTRFIQLET
jgi:hypothetical protein